MKNNFLKTRKQKRTRAIHLFKYKLNWKQTVVKGKMEITYRPIVKKIYKKHVGFDR